MPRCPRFVFRNAFYHVFSRGINNALCPTKHLGSIFQNRFKSILIKNNSYFLKLSRHIYLNPVRGGLIFDPLLHQYCSIREALGKELPLVLDEDTIRLVGETKKSLEEYEEFICGGLKKDFSEIERLFHYFKKKKQH